MDFSCPVSEDCKGHAAEEEIKMLVTVDAYEKYLRFKGMKGGGTDSRTCSQCQHVVIGHKDSPAMVCPKCDLHFCYFHDLAHPRMTCQAYATMMRRRDRETEREIARVTRKCPSCKVDTEKNGGCNHMTCQKCLTHWYTYPIAFASSTPLCYK